MTMTVQFGLGLVSLGRPWGFVKQPAPSREHAFELLQNAVHAGISFFDTAPSYGGSEALLGDFLRTLDSSTLDQLTIATKCGEHWDAEQNEPYTDHSYEALCRSIDQSLQRIPRLDLLQIHKPTPEILKSPDLLRVLAYAQSCGVPAFGVSVSDLISANIVIESDRYSYLQFPYNHINRQFAPVFALAGRHGKQVLINRPLGMGQHLYCNDGKHRGYSALLEAYRFILEQSFTGIILTGTISPQHLEEDLQAFRQAYSDCFSS
jgi:aryl-alcohol dehydrogenase-like predicted oxidoreductase